MAAEFIYERAPYPSCHASTIVESQPGKFLAAWFGGSREGADDVAIWLSRYDGRWSEPEKVADERGKPCWNPVLFRERKSGEIQLYYKAGPSPQTWSGFCRTSADGGKTFGEPRILPAGLLGPIKNKPVQLEDGVILAPTSVESYRNWACWVERSADGGKSWTKHGPIFHPEHADGIIQPSILRDFRRFAFSAGPQHASDRADLPFAQPRRRFDLEPGRSRRGIAEPEFGHRRRHIGRWPPGVGLQPDAHRSFAAGACPGRSRRPRIQDGAHAGIRTGRILVSRRHPGLGRQRADHLHVETPENSSPVVHAGRAGPSRLIR